MAFIYCCMEKSSFEHCFLSSTPFSCIVLLTSTFFFVEGNESRVYNGVRTDAGFLDTMFSQDLEEIAVWLWTIDRRASSE